MHSAKLKNSARLKRVFNLLISGNEYTTRQIVRKADVCAVNTCIDELRDNGLDIKCVRRGSLWFYRMVI
jgi:hypothetical protein